MTDGKVYVDGKEIEQVEEFCCQGNMMTFEGCWDKNIRMRLGKALLV